MLKNNEITTIEDKYSEEEFLKKYSTGKYTLYWTTPNKGKWKSEGKWIKNHIQDFNRKKLVKEWLYKLVLNKDVKSFDKQLKGNS